MNQLSAALNRALSSLENINRMIDDDVRRHQRFPIGERIREPVVQQIDEPEEKTDELVDEFGDESADEGFVERIHEPVSEPFSQVEEQDMQPTQGVESRAER